jgi:hypothetical protein
MQPASHYCITESEIKGEKVLNELYRVENLFDNKFRDYIGINVEENVPLFVPVSDKSVVSPPLPRCVRFNRGAVANRTARLTHVETTLGPFSIHATRISFILAEICNA